MSIIDIPAAEYHEDRVADQPTLSASIATILCQHTPAHARAAHPRLNPRLVREQKAAFDLGTTVHALLLENRDPAEIVKIIAGYDDWKKADAREQRDYWRDKGFIPLLEKNYYDVLAMVDAAAGQLREYDATPALLADGHPEKTLVWSEDGITCRSRLDWLRDDSAAIDDVKTTSRIGGANQHEFERSLYAHGYDVKAAFYLRAVKAVTGVDAVFRWIVIEAAAPYALSVIEPGPDVLALGEDKVEKAITLWRRCVETDEWPGYGRRVATAEMPAWAEAQWMERSVA